ncbi:MAG: hypothetical protein H6718_17650 [Polyangiaceae bacterium]|nr:hypothetical protein [Myxococcales bacterium]MCB9587228.1 hypothetical protein [Polyangiaceae bacterium]MCB9609389.1 hypothetical protein [Polyangiaceae bacterium]
MATLRELFPDTGLLLGVLNQLIELGVYSGEAVETALSDLVDKTYDAEELEEDEDDEEFLKARDAIARLSEWQVAEADLRRIEALDFDGGNPVYMSLEGGIDIDTGGEEDWYQVMSLDGVQRLSNLKRLNLDGHGYRDYEWLDLAVLEAHPALESLLLTGRCKSVASLDQLESLKELKLLGAQLDDESALDALKTKGVTITR